MWVGAARRAGSCLSRAKSGDLIGAAAAGMSPAFQWAAHLVSLLPSNYVSPRLPFSSRFLTPVLLSLIRHPSARLAVSPPSFLDRFVFFSSIILLTQSNLKMFSFYLFLLHMPRFSSSFRISLLSYLLFYSQHPLTQLLTPSAFVICGSPPCHTGLCLCRKSDSLQEGGIWWNCFSPVQYVYKGNN